MKTKQMVIILIILQSISNLLWILGLIFADINFFIIAMIVSVMYGIPTIKYLKDLTEFFKTRDGEVVSDERKEHIEEKAALPSYALMIIVSIYSGVAILTLRNSYPEYANLAYPFFIIVILGLISYMMSTAYYKRKYGN